jgi:type IV/VI secretion system ImpK/VasF family protein
MNVATLLDYFRGVFTYGLALDEQLKQGGLTAGSSEAIYAEIRNRIEQAQGEALRGEKRKEDVEEAAFAVAAWMDELVAQYPDTWEVTKALCMTMFGTRLAGNEFFDRFRRLTAQQDEVREVYFVALALGFVGQYFYEVGDSGELGRLKEMSIRHLPSRPPSLPGLIEEKLTPQPYRIADPVGRRLPSRWPDKLIKGGALVAVAAIVGIVAYFIFVSGREDGPDLMAIAAQVEPYPCHDFVITQRDSGAVEVAGHVRTSSERERLAKELRALRGGKLIELNVETLAEPFCEAVGLSAPLRNANQDRKAGFRISTQSGAERLVEDQIITLEARLPEEPVCLYVSYFVADGSAVVHLFPTDDTSQACVLKGDPIPIGRPKPGQAPWKVSPPFGREMVLAIATPKPLFSQRRQGIESPREYLDALRRALSGDAASGIADYILVTTEKKPQ